MSGELRTVTPYSSGNPQASAELILSDRTVTSGASSNEQLRSGVMQKSSDEGQADPDFSRLASSIFTNQTSVVYFLH